MSDRDALADYDAALAQVQLSQQQLVKALTAHVPAHDRADAVNAARRLLHDMDHLYMTVFARTIEQIKSMHDARWQEIVSLQRAQGDRQGRHAGLLADHDARLARVEALLGRIAAALEIDA